MEIACTNFKYFEGFENYRSEVYDTWLASKLGIKKYWFLKIGIVVSYRKVLIPEFGNETKFLKRKISISNNKQGGGLFHSVGLQDFWDTF